MSKNSFEELKRRGLEEHLGIKQAKVTVYWYEYVGLAVVSVLPAVWIYFAIDPEIPFAEAVGIYSLIIYATLYVCYYLAKEAALNETFTIYSLKLLSILFVIALTAMVLSGFHKYSVIALSIIVVILALYLWRLTLLLAIVAGAIAFAITSPLYFLLTIIAVAVVIIAINTSWK